MLSLHMGMCLLTEMYQIGLGVEYNTLFGLLPDPSPSTVGWVLLHVDIIAEVYFKEVI